MYSFGFKGVSSCSLGTTVSSKVSASDSSDVEAGVYDLAGRLVHRLAVEARGEGLYTESWDGLVKGQYTPPGTYLVRVAVDTDLGTFVKTRIIGIVY